MRGAGGIPGTAIARCGCRERGTGQCEWPDYTTGLMCAEQTFSAPGVSACE